MRRFQGHLIVEYDAIFSFLFDPTLDATNWRAEQALRLDATDVLVTLLTARTPSVPPSLRTVPAIH